MPQSYKFGFFKLFRLNLHEEPSTPDAWNWKFTTHSKQCLLCGQTDTGLRATQKRTEEWTLPLESRPGRK